MVMMRMQRHGHIPIALLGGGTTMVGDPSGRSDMRKVMTKETIDSNAEKFAAQLGRFLDFGVGGAIIENNANWLLDLNFLHFMRDICVHLFVISIIQFVSYIIRLEDMLTLYLLC